MNSETNGKAQITKVNKENFSWLDLPHITHIMSSWTHYFFTSDQCLYCCSEKKILMNRFSPKIQQKLQTSEAVRSCMAAKNSHREWHHLFFYFCDCNTQRVVVSCCDYMIFMVPGFPYTLRLSLVVTWEQKNISGIWLTLVPWTTDILDFCKPAKLCALTIQGWGN